MQHTVPTERKKERKKSEEFYPSVLKISQNTKTKIKMHTTDQTSTTPF
jgi:hypothetical protein